TTCTPRAYRCREGPAGGVGPHEHAGAVTVLEGLLPCRDTTVTALSSNLRARARAHRWQSWNQSAPAAHNARQNFHSEKDLQGSRRVDSTRGFSRREHRRSIPSI